ncbi:MAG: hypothetical protein EOM64_02150 [Erysipelotrichia bacterium]|nr:hypothetical protein [Erysipelotrichia bacterium]
MMKTVTGILNLVLFAILLLKGPIRKYGSRELNRFFFRLHKPVSGIVCLTVPVHLFYIWNAAGTYPLHSFFGIAAAAEYLVLVTLCHTMKNQTVKMRWHRILSALLLALLAGHVIIH